MFFSLIQTLVCVLLINGGLYALHLTGQSNSVGSSNSASLSSGGLLLPSSQSQSLGGSASANSMLNLLTGGIAQHMQHGGGSTSSGGGGGGILKQPPSATSSLKGAAADGRLSEELADMAQLERERLMLLGLAKQTAAAANGGATGHHGRPIITGRIQMSPADEVDGDYPALLLQQARGLMYGNVVRQPAPNEDYDSAEDYEGNASRRRPIKYEYGHIVQPSDREPYEAPHLIDLDEFVDAEPDIDDMLTDLDSYQYLDELLPPAHDSSDGGSDISWGNEQTHYGGTAAHHVRNHEQLLNPYRTLEELESSAPHTLQQLFEKEQHDAATALQHKPQHQQQQQMYTTQFKHRNGISGSTSNNNGGFNSRLQKKWQRKRAQQQQQQQQLQQWQRNIFGEQRQRQPQSYNTQQTKLAMANSEATATKHIDSSNNNKTPVEEATDATATQSQQQSSSPLLGASMAKSAQIEKQQQQHQTQPSAGKTVAAAGGSATATLSKIKLQQQKQKHQPHPQSEFLHPNHKRSGGGGMTGVGGAAPNNGYSSIASQLMLRTARGQRQYDVPQIECPTAMDGMERFACPTPDLQGRYRCIDDHVLCDGFIDCPEGEDEDRRSCMFYKTTKAHLDVLADALLRWARGR